MAQACSPEKSSVPANKLVLASKPVKLATGVQLAEPEKLETLYSRTTMFCAVGKVSFKLSLTCTLKTVGLVLPTFLTTIAYSISNTFSAI